MNANLAMANAQHLVPLAKELDENKVTPGLVGFIVFALIGGATWLLLRNMNKQFTKINFSQRLAEPDDPSQTAKPVQPAAEAAGAQDAEPAASQEPQEPHGAADAAGTTKATKRG